MDAGVGKAGLLELPIDIAGEHEVAVCHGRGPVAQDLEAMPFGGPI
jgi:hypothetical protein